VGCDGVPGSGKVLDACGVCDGKDDTCVVWSDQHFIGIMLSLMGNMLISFSLNCQKYAHNMNAKRAQPIPYQKMRLWWVGLGMMALGETGNFLAYAYAPATLVAPLGAVTVISNSLLAHFLLKEPWSLRNGLGCFLAVAGSIMIVTFAPSSKVQLTMDRLVRYMTEPVFVVFVTLVLCCAGALIMAPQHLKERYVFVYLGICSLMGCITVMCTKGVSKALVDTLNGHNQFAHFLPWVLLGGLGSTVYVQVKYLNMAMIHFGASEVVPVFYVMFTFCSILGGIILFKEFHEHGRNYTMYFLSGCMMTFSGVFCITYNSGKEKQRKNETVDPFDDLRMDAESMQLLSTGVDPDIDEDLEDNLFDEVTLRRNHHQMVAPE
jgi:drug/metabolite transporter (DMT)-like permease